MREQPKTRRYRSMITRYDPFREAVSLRRMMDHLFEQSFVNPSLMAVPTSMMVPMDVCETQKGYEVDVALPGVRPEDIELTVDQNSLTIRGQFSQQNEHQNQPQGQGQQQAQQGQPQAQPQAKQQTQQGGRRQHRDGKNWLSREIVTGSFERTVTLPRRIDINEI